jgi:hypothetical protein
LNTRRPQRGDDPHDGNVHRVLEAIKRYADAEFRRHWHGHADVRSAILEFRRPACRQLLRSANLSYAILALRRTLRYAILRHAQPEFGARQLRSPPT